MYFAANLPRNPLMAQTNSESVFATQVSTPLLVLVLSSQNLVLVTHLVLLVHVASVGILGGAGGGGAGAAWVDVCLDHLSGDPLGGSSVGSQAADESGGSQAILHTNHE